MVDYLDEPRVLEIVLAQAGVADEHRAILDKAASEGMHVDGRRIARALLKRQIKIVGRDIPPIPDHLTAIAVSPGGLARQSEIGFACNPCSAESILAAHARRVAECEVVLALTNAGTSLDAAWVKLRRKLKLDRPRPRRRRIQTRPTVPVPHTVVQAAPADHAAAGPISPATPEPATAPAKAPAEMFYVSRREPPPTDADPLPLWMTNPEEREKRNLKLRIEEIETHLADANRRLRPLERVNTYQAQELRNERVDLQRDLRTAQNRLADLTDVRPFSAEEKRRIRGREAAIERELASRREQRLWFVQKLESQGEHFQARVHRNHLLDLRAEVEKEFGITAQREIG
jgi:hypothetical protein